MKYLAVLGRQPEISIAELEIRYSLDGSCSAGPAAASSPILAKARLGVPQAASPADVTLY
jgi:hypothetical protein